ncbi:MAG: DHH family phosphoesterase [Clostridia bacterium]|nr:DHH family phosphoesterase [Clostridia bacterium]
MAKKLYKSEKKVFIFDLVYTLITSALSLFVFIFGSSLTAEDGRVNLGVFVLIAFSLFMLAGMIIRSQIISHKAKRGEKTELYNIGALFFGKMHLQLAVINSSGEIITANDAFREAFLSSERRMRISIYDLFTFPDGEDHILFDRDGGTFSCEYADRIYDVTSTSLGESGNAVLIFEDRTERRELIAQYEQARVVVAYIELDNISDLSNGTFASRNKSALDAFDALVKSWGEERGIIICEHDSWKYLAVMSEGVLDALMAEGFSSLLAPVSEIKTESGVSLSFSLGSSNVTEGGVESRHQSSLSAFEMAVNRGGATAAVKCDGEILYYGGNVKAQPKRAKNRARYNARQLEQLIKDADNVLIMGHSMPDYDCIGAQMGVYCLCRELRAEAYIVSNGNTYFNITEALPMIERMRGGQAYRDAFISPDAALDKNGTGTLLVCVDVSNTEKMESSALFEAVPRVVVVDHHRKYAEFPRDTELEYIDTSASSASELVSEMLEMLDLPGGSIMREEATMMLSGIYLDTDNFRKSTGTRTFSAALFLRDKGADVDTVKRFFDISVKELELESRIAERVEIVDENIAIISYDTKGEQTDPKTRARVADSFVRAKEVEAAFVLCGEAEGPVNVSARSAGKINVELVMKKLGGGGSFDRAGGFITAGLDECTEMLKSAIRETVEKSEEK